MVHYHRVTVCVNNHVDHLCTFTAQNEGLITKGLSCSADLLIISMISWLRRVHGKFMFDFRVCWAKNCNKTIFCAVSSVIKLTIYKVAPSELFLHSLMHHEVQGRRA